jgi:hypothetical protein
VTWLLAVNGTNRRRVHQELALVDAVGAWLRHHRPSWRMRSISPEDMAFVDEARAVAESDIVVSLFGSALHSCRYMRRGTLALEIHGALRNDMGADFFYFHTCAKYGVRWVGFPVPGFMPKLKVLANGKTKFYWQNADGELTHDGSMMTSRGTAFVDAVSFVPFFARACRALADHAEWLAMVREFAATLRAAPDPKRALMREIQRREWYDKMQDEVIKVVHEVVSRQQAPRPSRRQGAALAAQAAADGLRT